MKKSGPAPDRNLVWSVPVTVAQLPESGLRQRVEADSAQREAIAAAVGVTAVLQAVADFDLMPVADGRVDVRGRVKARVEQACVVTLDPVENEIDETVDVTFAPPSRIAASPKPAQADEGEEADIPDPPEPIVNGVIDLGKLATEFLVLGIDPYPRKPGVTFTPPETPEDPDEHPFAALRALKAGPGGSQGGGAKKPKGK
ncbi:MAG: phosphodiesterase [Afipia sp. 62-7]|nr:DUF177 domain-containing protein [Afipia sp.]OJU20275.1 MAG: phosphodiesterase [Afipia sp. 62-7]